MTNDEFKSTLTDLKYYLKPALFTVLSENADIFSEETKKEIIDKLMEADAQMKDLYDYQDKRNGIMRNGIEKIEEFYRNLKAQFKQTAKNDMETDKSQADQLISNL